MEDNVYCPMIDSEIDIADCIENVDVVDGLIIENSLPQKYKQKHDWKEICKKCKYHNY